MGNFVKDIKRGKKREDLLKVVYNNARMKSISVNSQSSERKFWDVATEIVLYGESIEVLQEAKYDEMEAITHNIAIEFACSGTASGIDSTKADIWVQILKDGSMWSTGVKKLRNYIETVDHIIKPGGDGKRASMHLFPSAVIRSAIFTRIDTMTAEELRAYLEQEYMENHGQN